MELDEKDKKGVTQKVFGQWNKDYKKMKIWIPKIMTVLVVMSILLLTASSLPASILFTVTYLISLMVIRAQQIK